MLRVVVRAAILEIGQIAFADCNEASAALIVKYLFAYAAWLGRCDAGPAQSLFEVYVLPMHQAPGARDDVVQRPDGQLIVADSDSRFEGHSVRALKPVSAADGPLGKENVVAVPLLLDLQNALASLSRLCCQVGIADVLMVDAQMRALVDIGFWPRDVCVPFRCGLLQCKQLGLIQAGRVTAAQRPAPRTSGRRQRSFGCPAGRTGSWRYSMHAPPSVSGGGKLVRDAVLRVTGKEPCQ